jgi:hypothetical protein
MLTEGNGAMLTREKVPCKKNDSIGLKLIQSEMQAIRGQGLVMVQ